VRHALDRIRERVREVVHRVDAPAIAGAVVRRRDDPVEQRVAQHQHGRRHVDLRAQRARARLEFAGAHAAEEIEILLAHVQADDSRPFVSEPDRRHLLRRGIADEREPREILLQ
jgi:hypothetical protein